MRELALFDLGIDSKLRACDLLKLKVRDVCHGERVAARAIVVQQKTSRPVQFEITEPTRTALANWIGLSGLVSDDFLFPSRVRSSPHLSTRQHARIVDSWVEEIGLDLAAYGTHSIRRTKPSLIYRRTKNLRAVHLLLGHTKLESTVRYLGIEVEDALEMAEQTDAQQLARLGRMITNRGRHPARDGFAQSAVVDRVGLFTPETPFPKPPGALNSISTRRALVRGRIGPLKSDL
jgi:integrase